MISAEDLEAIGASIYDVLAEQCTSADLHRHFDGDASVTETIWMRAASLGWLGIAIPEADGGLGLGYRGLALLFERLGARLTPGPFLATIPAATWLASGSVLADDGQLLASIIRGDVQLALPAQRSVDPIRLLRGKLHGNIGPILSSPTAAFAILPAWDGGSGCLVLLSMGSPGLKVKPVALWDRSRFATMIDCDGVRPVMVIEDPTGGRSRSLYRLLDVAVAADSIGAAEALVRQTVEYLKAREQFGKPLASLQALKHRAARLMLTIATAKEMLCHAVETSEREAPDADMWAALAKVSATEAFRFVADDCVQLHGGIGMTWEFDSHLFLKRALFNEVLVDDSHAELDFAEEYLRAATVAGRSTTELAAHA